ncbi:hydrolase [Seminavis robusta]|uniref:Hydrolase n=1 Tax=Seminavis robusta TaxID=568900 RepID=A0A9N8DS83_9STRA|nr:hydrolase [Seminavis robusta]|eukprot:Sro315_g115380.1 hydrolase (421) ;mRNA; f:60982-62244
MMWTYSRALLPFLQALTMSAHPPDSLIELSSRPQLRGVIFDMDGTLTEPNLDFALMYRRCGVDQKQDILQAIDEMENEDDAQRAAAIVEEMEGEGRRTLQLMPGTLGILQFLAYYKIPTALVTRNTRATTERFMGLLQHANGPIISPIVARDTEPLLPPKPDTAALQYIAQEWKEPFLSKEFVMVGDSPANDILFGKAAGVSTALLWQQQGEPLHRADVVVQHLTELPKHWYQTFHLSLSTTKTPSISNSPTRQHSSTNRATMAALHGDMETLQSLSITEILTPDDTGSTLLIWAAEGGQEMAVQFLLDTLLKSKTAKLQRYMNHRGFQGNTAVSRAARHGHLAVLHQLTRAPVIINLNIPNDKLQYPLHIAAFRQHHDFVQELLKAGADAHVVDRKGRTPWDDTSSTKIQTLLQSCMST